MSRRRACSSMRHREGSDQRRCDPTGSVGAADLEADRLEPAGHDLELDTAVPPASVVVSVLNLCVLATLFWVK
jgi:hypothetical protein